MNLPGDLEVEPVLGVLMLAVLCLCAVGVIVL